MNILIKISCVALTLMALFFIADTANAASDSSQPRIIATPNGALTVECYSSLQQAPSSAVVILHGRQGLQALHPFYQRVAQTFSQAGFNAYLVNYYSGDDITLANNPDAAPRRAFFAERVRGWSQEISALLSEILSDSRNNGTIALLGFSQGGFVAVSVAGLDSRVSALCVFYGGIPVAVQSEVLHLPPLLEFHGDADRTVPLSNGKELVEWAKGLGGKAQIVVLPNAGHGFSKAENEHALRQAISFFTHAQKTP